MQRTGNSISAFCVRGAIAASGTLSLPIHREILIALPVGSVAFVAVMVCAVDAATSVAAASHILVIAVGILRVCGGMCKRATVVKQSSSSADVHVVEVIS